LRTRSTRHRHEEPQRTGFEAPRVGALLIEYEAVMTRPEHLRAARLTTDDIGALLDAVAAVAEPVGLAFLWRPVLPDGDDDMVLETAMNGRAYGIVTFNRRDFEAAV